MVLRLKVIDQPATAEAGLKLEYDVLTSGSIVLGRNKDCDWILRDDRLDISMKHCEITASADGFTLNDISTNGVFLNRAAKRMSGPHKLADGDVFSIGRFVVEAHIDGRPIADAPPAEASAGSEERVKSGGRNSDPAAAAFSVGHRQSALTFGREAGDMGMTFITPADKRPAGVVGSAPRPAPEPEPPTAVPPTAVEPPPTAVTPPAPTPAVTQPIAVSAPKPSAWTEDDAPNVTGASLARLAAGLGLDVNAFATGTPDDVLFRVGQLTRQLAEVVATLQTDHRRTLRTLGSRRIAMPLNNRARAASFSDNVSHALTDLLTSPASADEAVSEAGAALIAHQKALLAAAMDAAGQMATALDPSALAGGDAPATADRKARLWDTYRAIWSGIDPDWSAGFLEAYRVMLGAAYDDASAGAAKSGGHRP